MKVQLLRDAEEDINEAALWYDDHEPGLGDEFLAEVGQRLEGLVSQPHVWPLWPGTREGKYPIHRRLMTRFPYGIAYQVVGDAIIVVAVAAHKRRPRYWVSRARR